MRREVLTSILLAPVLPSFIRFSDNVKDEVRESQHNICADTGIQSRHLEIHHIVPQALGGSDRIENAIGLAGEHDKIDAHEKWDKLAFERGVIYPGVPLTEAKPEMIKDRKKFDKACRKLVK